MNERPRRRFLQAAGAVALATLGGCASSPDAGESETDGAGDTTTASGSTEGGATTTRSTTQKSSTPPEGVATERIASGFTSPIGFEVAPGTDRRFVLDQSGVVHEVTDSGTRRYFDLRDRVVEISGYSEMGLLGLAFHPGFADNGRLFVRYSAPSREGTPGDFSHTFVLAEYRVDPAAESVSPGREAERALLELPQPQPNHNAGAVTFGPDGLLYVAVGDGGSAGDRGKGHVEDWYDANPGGNGQDVTENLLGSIVRIDVDREGEDRPYGVPGDNPLVGAEGRDELFAWGFRNPWRMSVEDLADGPALVAADVGQADYEEINVVRKGANYGWNVREGRSCFRAEECPEETPDGEPLVDPVVTYPHGSPPGPSGVAVVGGFVHTGDQVPALAGKYVFADWRAGGELFVADPAGDRWEATIQRVNNGPRRLPLVLALGRHDGELFVCSTRERSVTGTTGEVHRLVAGEAE